MKTIRVGINASGLAAPKHATGLQRYLACLVTHLAERAEQDDLALFLYFAGPVAPEYRAPGTLLDKLAPGPRIRWRSSPVGRGWHRIGMGLTMQLDRLDVFHFPAPLMAGYCPVPSIVTFHDLAALSLEADQTQKERTYLADAYDAGQRATALIAVSRSAAEEVAHYLDRPDVTVISEGVDLGQFRPATPAEVAVVRARYGLDRYVLCVGTLQMRKNHIRLIQAFERVQHEYPHTLVVAGGDGSGAQALHEHLAAHPNPRVKLLGYVDEHTLPALYTGADVLALPSLWEGFGLPLIEAMACGTPVLTSNVSSLLEVAANVAEIVNPRDVDDIARGLHMLLGSETQRRALSAAGLRRAQDFTWDETARHTAALYRHVVDRQLARQ